MPISHLTNSSRSYMDSGVPASEIYAAAGDLASKAGHDIAQSNKSNLIARTVTLLKPEQRNFLVRFWDKYFGGGKLASADLALAEQRKALAEKHIEDLCQPDEVLAPDAHLKRMEAFVALRNLVPSKHKDDFRLDIDYGNNPDYWVATGGMTMRLHYRFVVDGTTLVSGQLDEADPALNVPSNTADYDRALSADPVRDAFLAFHRSMARSEIQSPALADTSLEGLVQTRHADAMLLTQLAAAVPEFPESAMASLAAKLDDINRAPQSKDTPYVGMGRKMQVLSAALPNHRFMVNLRQDRGHFDISLRPANIADLAPHATAYETTLLSVDVPSDAHQRVQVLALAIMETGRTTAYELQDKKALYESGDNFISMNAPEMGADRDAWQVLMNESENSAYSNANLYTIQDDPKTNTFTAFFVDSSHPEVEVVHVPIKLGGAALRERLSQPFTSLGQLVREGYLTERDFRLRNVLEGVHNAFVRKIDADLSAEERTAFHQSIGNITVGNTNLRALWDLLPSVAASAAQVSSVSVTEGPPKFDSFYPDAPAQWVADPPRHPIGFFDRLV